jgi:TolB-like protein
MTGLRYPARRRTPSPRLPVLLAAAGLFLSALATAAAPEELPLIAVLPFEAVETSAAEATAVSTLLETGLVDTGAWNVLGQAERDRIFEAQTQQASPARCTDQRCAVEIGKLLSADQVVLGALARVDSKLIINAKIIDVAGSRTVVADSISASTPEELEGACRSLARQLAARARPGAQLAGGAATAAGEGSAASGTVPGAGHGQGAGGPPPPAGEPAGGGQATAPGSSAAGEAVGSGGGTASAGEEAGTAPLPEGGILPGTPAGAESAARGKFWTSLSGAGAALLGLLGNVSGSMAFELRHSSDEAYADYLAAASGFDALWKDYTGLYTGYAATTIGAYSCWTLAAAAPPLYLGLDRRGAFQLTPVGRRLYAWGTALTVAGSFLDLLAGAQRYRVDFLYDDYMSAGADWDRLYDRYVAGYALYMTERIVSYTLWGLGAAGAAGAFFLRGERQPVVAGFLEKALTVVGTALISGGSVTGTVALNARQEYANSGGADNRAYDRYVGYSVASCLLWAAGGTALLLPVVRDLPGSKRGRGAPAEELPRRPAELRLLPAPGGLLLQVSWDGLGSGE